jgi:hypothetical protein
VESLGPFAVLVAFVAAFSLKPKENEVPALLKQITAGKH